MELMTMTMVQDQPHQGYQKGGYKGFPHDIAFNVEKSGIKQEVPFDSTPLEMDAHHQATMRKLVNKLGGTYCSGKPLSMAIRRQIVAMADSGMKACDISRQLQISHGCVSKIIAKWRATGSFEPRRIGGSKPKKTIGDVVAAVRMYKRSCPTIRSLEIRRRLLEDGVCNECNVPSLSSINRIIRMKLRDDLAEFEANAVRDLMTLLASSNLPNAQGEGPTANPMAHPIASAPMSPDALSEEHHTVLTGLCPPPKMQLQSQERYQLDRIYETKLQSLPVAPPSFMFQPDTMGTKLSQMHLGVIPRSRCARNTSTTSTSSTSSYGSDGSYEPWSGEMASGANSDNEEQHGLSTNAYGNTSDLMNLNFDNDDLWSLLDELPVSV